MRKPGFERLRVLRGRADASPCGGTKHHRYLPFPPIHVSGLGRLINNIIHHVNDKVHERHVYNGAHPRHRGTNGGTRYGIFGNGSIAHPLFAKLLEHPDGCTEVASENTYVFPHQKHVLIATHLFGHSHDNSIANGH